MKNLLLAIFLLVAGCSDNSDNAKQPANNVASANESANNQVENLLATRYSAISNWEKNLPRHGAGSAIFSVDVQKALSSASPILFRARLRDVFQSKEGFTKRVENLIAVEDLRAANTNREGITCAEFRRAYKQSNEPAAQTDFALDLYVELNGEQAQKILSAPKDVLSDEYAIVVKVSKAASLDTDDDWPTIYAEGTCVDFSLLK